MSKNAYRDGKHDAEHMLGNCVDVQYNEGSHSYREYLKGYNENQPKFCVPQYVLQSCFHRKETSNGLVFWRECTHDGFPTDVSPDEVGYLVLYADGEHLHTYQHPENWL